MTRRRPHRRRRRRNVWDFLWQLYNSNHAVQHLVTVVAMAITVMAVGVTNRMHADSMFGNVAGVQRQIDGRLNTIQNQTSHQHRGFE